jgi:DNA-binding LacI/PurR family transcriptional regulator
MSEPEGARLQVAVAPDRLIGRATLSSVARLAGVSKQTVSNVLNSPHLVRIETARKVQAAIADLGYRPHRAAQQLRTRRSRVLALRVELAVENRVFDRFLHALTEAADHLDYRVMLYTAADDDAEIAAYDRLSNRWDIDGYVLTATHPGDRRTTYLSQSKIPCVTFGRPWDDSDHHPWVDVDGAAGTGAATEQLIEAGHRRIGFLGWPEGSGVGDDRLAGWRQAVIDAGLDQLEAVRCVNETRQGRLAAADLLDRVHPTAIVCVSDTIALGVLGELGSRGLRAGSDVAVIGFDDTDLAEISGLSSVSQPLVAAAQHCVRLLTQVIESGAASAERTLLPPAVVVRSSTAPESPAAAATGPPAPSLPPVRPPTSSRRKKQ